MIYIAFYVKPGQGFLFPQEVAWLYEPNSIKRPTLKEYNEIKNTKQVFVGAAESNGRDILCFTTILVSDLEPVEVTEELGGIVIE